MTSVVHCQKLQDGVRQHLRRSMPSCLAPCNQLVGEDGSISVEKGDDTMALRVAMILVRVSREWYTHLELILQQVHLLVCLLHESLELPPLTVYIGVCPLESTQFSLDLLDMVLIQSFTIQ